MLARREHKRWVTSLAVWMGITPLVPLLHLACADHRHFTCVEHNRIEDFFGADRQAGFRIPPSGRDPTVQRDKSDLRSGHSCLILNSPAGRPSISRSNAPQLPDCLSGEVRLLAALDSWHPALAVFLLAPKTSPPDSPV